MTHFFFLYLFLAFIFFFLSIFLSFFHSFVLFSFLLCFSKMISNYIASVGWLTMRNCKKEISNKPSSIFRVTEPEFTCRTERMMEKFVTSSVLAGTHLNTNP